MIFDQAFDELMRHEGGWSDHAADPGGKTMYGVTEAVARANGYSGDMRMLSKAFAAQVYRREYWDACRCDDLPPAIRYAVFDGAVNSGVGQSVRWLQRAVEAKADGIVGPDTIARARAFHPDLLSRRMLSQRLRFMTDLKTWPHFGRGWARRVAELLEA